MGKVAPPVPLEQCRTPVQVIASEKSSLWPYAMNVRYFNRLGGPKELLTLNPDPRLKAGIPILYNTETEGYFLRTDHVQFGQGIGYRWQNAAQNFGVAVHCTAGFGRTGTILACWFVHQGHPSQAAIAKVRDLRPGSVETNEQEDAVLEFGRRTRV